MAGMLKVRVGGSWVDIPTGPTGPPGTNGQGVVVGGSTGQVLTKVSGTDYDTNWQTPSGGAGTPQPTDTFQSTWTWKAAALSSVSSGQIALNATTPAGATIVYIAAADNLAKDWSVVELLLKTGDLIHIRSVSAPTTRFLTFELYSSLTNNFSYIELPASQPSGWPVGTEPTEGESVIVSFTIYNIPVSRSIATTAPLAGGGNLSANRTLTVASFAGSAAGVVPTSPGGTTDFLRADGSWAAPVGAVTQAYVDAEVTVSTSAPVGAPSRNGILWVVVP